MVELSLDTVRKKVLCIMENNGVLFDLENENDLIDVSTIDSITFISFIVDVENEFEIVFPEELLSFDTLRSINGFTRIVFELLNEEKG